MRSKSDNIKVMTYWNLVENIEKLFDSLLCRYQIGLEIQMRGSDFICDCVNFFYYKCHKLNFKRGGSYIDSPDWIKKKTATINTRNEADKCLRNVLKLRKIESHP